MCASLTPTLHQVWGLCFPPWCLALVCCPLSSTADGKSLAEGQLAPAGQDVEGLTLRDDAFVDTVGGPVSMTAAASSGIPEPLFVTGNLFLKILSLLEI